jgi:CRP/FNR family transcriptional regulator
LIKIDSAAVTRVALEYPDFGWFISQQVSLAYASLPRVVEELASMTVRQRLASHLLELAVRDGGGNLFVEIDQEALAEAVCSVREVVSRALSSLRDDGLITKAGRLIVIVDEPGLRRTML